MSGVVGATSGSRGFRGPVVVTVVGNAGDAASLLVVGDGDVACAGDFGVRVVDGDLINVDFDVIVVDDADVDSTDVDNDVNIVDFDVAASFVDDFEFVDLVVVVGDEGNVALDVLDPDAVGVFCVCGAAVFDVGATAIFVVAVCVGVTSGFDVAATPARYRSGPLPPATASIAKGKGKVNCLCRVKVPLVPPKVKIAPLLSPTSTSFLMGVRLTHVREGAMERGPGK